MQNFRIEVDETPVLHKSFVYVRLDPLSLMIMPKSASRADAIQIANYLKENVDHISFMVDRRTQDQPALTAQ